jgi:transcriptional regulator with GAF, ATPase, and Fis domain
LDRIPHPEDPRPSAATTEPPVQDSGTDLVPEARIPLLHSTGEFTCPHCSGTIRLQGIGLRFEGSEASDIVQLDLRHPEESLDEVVDDVRRALAIRALKEANGVKVKAAEIAGMKYTTFYELVRRLGITDDDLKP